MTTTNENATRVITPSRTGDGKGWVYAGVAAGLAGITSIVGSTFVSAVYDKDVAGNAVGITQRLSEQTAQILVFHTGAMVSALLLIAFAAGLRRRLTRVVPTDSLIPQVATSGLLLVSVALLMGSALTTEFVFGVKDPDLLVPEAAAMFGHWIGTVPWLWGGAGVAAIALGLAGRRYAATSGWLAWVSLVLGGLTTLFAISPLQYMSGMTGPLWLTVAAIGLLRNP